MKDLILITGSEGMIGSRFVELFPNKDSLHIPRQIEFDITDHNQVKALIASYDFKSVVHFAAYTDVSEAEKQKGDKNGTCWQVNVEGTRNLIEAVKPYKTKVHFIQISTDMVFSGAQKDPGPYKEDHKPESDPEKLTWYGFTKAEAERIVSKNLGENATILRLIYPVRANFDAKPDYLRRRLQLFDEGKLYPMFTDQQISISYIDEICEAITKIIAENKKGIYHASSGDITTPFELISYLLEKTRGVTNVVKGNKLKDFLKESGSSPNRYPQFGGLDVKNTEKELNISFSSWKQIVDKLSVTYS